MTKQLYYEDIYRTAFESTVLECVEEKSGRYRVLLEATAFFPEAGGQTADKGTLDGVEVIAVQIVGENIYHYVGQPFAVGTTVRGQVDYAQRFDFMQQHSGEHIISGLVHARYGLRNVGFHLSVREVTLDFDAPLTMEQLREIEREANEVVQANLPIQITYPDKEELASLSYRSKIEIEGQVRIVTIPGIDVCACCAPHVESTGRIGMIKITDVQSLRGGVRVTILCGMRAHADYAAKQDHVSALSVALSLPGDRLVEGVQRLREEVQKQKERANHLQAEYLRLMVSTLPSPVEAADAILFVGAMDTIAVRSIVNELTKAYTGYCGIFFGAEGNYQFVLGSKTQDCRVVAERLRMELSARCGGNVAMIQGSVSAEPAQLRELFRSC